MAGSKRKRLLLDLNSSPLSSESQTPPTPPSATDSTASDSTATPTNVVGDQAIPSLSAVSGVEVNNDTESPIPSPQGLPKHKIPYGHRRIFGKLHPQPSILQSRRSPPPPTDTTATSIRLVADQPIPVASPVNDPQDNDNPPQPPAPRPNAPVRPRRNGTALDPNTGGFYEDERLWECKLWFPDVLIPGRSTLGLQIHLGYYRTKQEAQDVADRVTVQ